MVAYSCNPSSRMEKAIHIFNEDEYVSANPLLKYIFKALHYGEDWVVMGGEEVVDVCIIVH